MFSSISMGPITTWMTYGILRSIGCCLIASPCPRVTRSMPSRAYWIAPPRLGCKVTHTAVCCVLYAAEKRGKRWRVSHYCLSLVMGSGCSGRRSARIQLPWMAETKFLFCARLLLRVCSSSFYCLIHVWNMKRKHSLMYVPIPHRLDTASTLICFI